MRQEVKALRGTILRGNDVEHPTNVKRFSESFPIAHVARLLCIVFLLCTALMAADQKDAMPRFQHVFLVVEENQSYESVIGNNTDMPYLNSLAKQYGLATNYFANTHPSINNYFYLTAGRQGTKPPFWGPTADLYPFDVDGSNLASVLSANGKTWKAYAEGLPHAGYVGGSKGAYAKRHNPFAYFEMVRKSKQQRDNIVPFKQFAKDLQDHSLPDFSFIVPNLYHDGHNDQTTHSPAGCGDHRSMKAADDWLRQHIEPLIQSPDFQSGGLLIVTFDEACDSGPHSDLRLSPNGHNDDGGGHVATVLVSPDIKPGTTSDELFHHQSVLRTVLEGLGVHTYPGLSATAPDMSAFFGGSPAAGASGSNSGR